MKVVGPLVLVIGLVVAAYLALQDQERSNPGPPRLEEDSYTKKAPALVLEVPEIPRVSADERQALLEDSPEEEPDHLADLDARGEEELKRALEQVKADYIDLHHQASVQCKKEWAENLKEHEIPDRLYQMKAEIPEGVLYATLTRRRDDGNFDVAIAPLYERDFPELYELQRRRRLIVDQLGVVAAKLGNRGD